MRWRQRGQGGGAFVQGGAAGGVGPAVGVARAATTDPRIRKIALLLQDGEGQTVGGLWGQVGYDWLFVELLVVPEGQRGQGLGRRLMAQAERIAADDGCAGVWLDTFSFQARGFYEKLGYGVFGTLEDHPRDGRRYFMSKRIDARGP